MLRAPSRSSAHQPPVPERVCSQLVDWSIRQLGKCALRRLGNDVLIPFRACRRNRAVGRLKNSRPLAAGRWGDGDWAIGENQRAAGSWQVADSRTAGRWQKTQRQLAAGRGQVAVGNVKWKTDNEKPVNGTEGSGRLAESRNEGKHGRRGDWVTKCRRGAEARGRAGRLVNSSMSR